MSIFLRHFSLLLKKEVLTEMRQREAIVVALMLSIIGAVVAALGISNAYLEPSAITRLTPTLLWLLFIFIAAQALSRGHDAEIELRALDRIIVSEVAPAALYLAKLTLAALLALLGHVVAVSLFVAMVGFSFGGTQQLVQFGLVSMLVCLGFSALAVLTTAMTVSSSARGTLVPLLILPIFFPPLLAAVSLTSNLNSPLLSSPWFTILVVCDLVYVLLGIALYPIVIRD